MSDSTSQAARGAIPVLKMNGNSFEIDQGAFNSVLDKVGDRPFVLFSINGATRTGKSYALNHFIRFLESTKLGAGDKMGEDWFDSELVQEFTWRSGAKRETKGMNLWSEPYMVPTGVGSEVALLLMDTQGLFDAETTPQQNAIIFSLSSLCSSVMIFNLMKAVDENVLQNLQFFSDYAHMVSTSPATAGSPLEGGDATTTNPFQGLVFLMRDFQFPEYEYGYHGADGAPEGGKNYFRDTFILEANSTCPPENRMARQKILESFKTVSMFLMPDPGRPFLKNSASASPDAEFRQFLQLFVQLMTSPDQLFTKRVGGVQVTGTEFKSYVEAWANLCKNAESHFPPVQSFSESTAVMQNAIAKRNAFAFYKSNFDEFLQKSLAAEVSIQEFESMHKIFFLDALEMFQRMRKLRNDAVGDEYRLQLETDIVRLYESNKRIVETEQESRVQRQELEKREREAAEGMAKMRAELEEMRRVMIDEKVRIEMQLAEEQQRRLEMEKGQGELMEAEIRRRKEEFEKEKVRLAEEHKERAAQTEALLQKKITLANENLVDLQRQVRQQNLQAEMIRQEEGFNQNMMMYGQLLVNLLARGVEIAISHWGGHNSK